MPKARIFKYLICLCLICSLVSCKQVDTLLVGKWFDLIYNELGLQVSQTNLPYFNDIDTDSYYYDIVQSLADWKILNSEDKFELEANLTQDIYVKTLLRIDRIDSDNYLQYAYDIGLIDSLDQKQLVDKKKAFEQLKIYVDKRNNEKIESSYELKQKEDIKDIGEFNLSDNILDIKEIDGIKEKDILYINDEYYEVQKIIEDRAYLQEATATDVYEDINISGESELDFSNAQIIEDDEVIDMTNYSSSLKLRLSALDTLQNKSFTYKDFKINISITSSRISASIENNNNDKPKMYANLSVHSIKPKYRFKMHDGIVEDAYFKVNFKANEAIGIRKGIAQDLYADFRNLDPNDFLNSCQNLFKKGNNQVSATIPIATIKIPIPEVPSVSIMLRLQLNIYASGRVELAFSSDHEMGMEVQNNNLRLINKHDHKEDFIIKANASAMSRIFVGLSLQNLNLMDLYVEAGIKSLIQAILHIYDTNNNQTLIKSDLPLDLLDDASEKNENIFACGDMDLYFLLNVGFNSTSSVLGRLNLRKNFAILNENNSSLINDGKNHIENWHFVDKCTRTSRNTSKVEDNIMETSQIKISDYNILVKLNGSNRIDVVGLPKGYNLKDIEYITSDDNVIVDDSGNVLGIKEGSSIITIRTKDNKYSADCHVLVVKK